MWPLGRVIGFPAPGHPRRFRRGAPGSRPPSPDRRETNRFIRSRLSRLFRVLRSLARRTSSPGAFLGVSLPLRDINPAQRSSGLPSSPWPPSSTFLTSSTVSSAPGLAGLLHPAATSRVLPSGAFPPAQPHRLIGGRALSPLTVARCRRFDPSAPPAPAPTSGPCSTRESVVPTAGS